MGKSLNGKELGKGITQRKDGTYQATYYNEVGDRKYLYDKNLRSLKRRQKDKQREIETNKMLGIIPCNKTLNDVYLEYLELRGKDLKTSTLNGYMRVYEKVQDMIGNKRVNQFTKVDFERVTNYIDTEYSNSLYQNLYSILHNLLKLALDAGYIDEINIPKKKKIKKKKDSVFLNKKDISILFNYFKQEKAPTYVNYFVLAIYTGLRVSEIAGIKESDIDFENNVLHINRQINYYKDKTINEKNCSYHENDPKSSHSKNSIPINRLVKEALLSQIEYRNNSNKIKSQYNDLIFFTNQGNPICGGSINNHLEQVYNRIGNQLSVDRLSTHIFRHTFATMCIDISPNLKIIQRLMRHSSVAMTERYLHSDNDLISVAVTQLETKFDVNLM